MRGLFALSPVMVLLVVYLVSSLLAGDFYRIPIGVSFVVAAVYSIMICTERSFAKRVNIFSAGAADSNIMYDLDIRPRRDIRIFRKGCGGR